MLHTVDLAAFLRLAANSSGRRWYLSCRHCQQAHVLLVSLEWPGWQLYMLDRCTLYHEKRNVKFHLEVRLKILIFWCCGVIFFFFFFIWSRIKWISISSKKNQMCICIYIYIWWWYTYIYIYINVPVIAKWRMWFVLWCSSSYFLHC